MGVFNKSGSVASGSYTLAELGLGEVGVIQRINADASLKRRLIVMGVVKGTEVVLEHKSPMGDPRSYTLLGYQLSLRNEDARKIMLKGGR